MASLLMPHDKRCRSGADSVPFADFARTKYFGTMAFRMQAFFNGRFLSGSRQFFEVFLKRDLNFYKALLDNLYDGVYFMDLDRKILYWNRAAERITGYTRSEVEGSHCWDNILMHVDMDGKSLCEGVCPASKTMQSGVPCEAEVFLHHKSGYRVPVRVRITPIHDDSGAVVGGLEVFNDNSEKIASLSMIEDLKGKAFQDPLTGLPNRRFLERFILSRLDEMGRYNWGFGLLFIDIDHFKQINDRYGHNVGDEALKMVANSLLHSSRSFDTVGRWGGEEFVAALINVDSDSLRRIAERYRAMIESSQLDVDGHSIKLTVSLGATIGRVNDTILSIVKRSDRLMYRSKQAGRNRVSLG